METFLFYLLRSSLVAILLYGIFKAIFSQTTFHRANRIALDSILAVSVVFPLFRFRLIPETAHSMMDISAINGSNLSELPVSSVGQSLWQNIPWIEIIAIFISSDCRFSDSSATRIHAIGGNDFELPKKRRFRMRPYFASLIAKSNPSAGFDIL